MAAAFSVHGVPAHDHSFAAESKLWPKAQLSEQGGKYLLSVALPGFEAADISVTPTQRAVIVHAKPKGDRKDGDGTNHWSEFNSNDMYRRFELTKNIDVQSLSASLENGILRIVATQDAEDGDDKRSRKTEFAEALPPRRLPRHAHEAHGDKQDQAAAQGAVEKPGAC